MREQEVVGCGDGCVRLDTTGLDACSKLPTRVGSLMRTAWTASIPRKSMFWLNGLAIT